MNKLRILIVLALLLLSFSLSAQDIVYDSIQGNPAYWMRIKGGPEQIDIKTSYENLGYLTKSKVLVGAGILDGLTAGVDYKDYTFNYDTLTYEFHTDVPINMIIYRYFYNDTLFRNFIGLRKAEIGAGVFDGKYMFICPIVDTKSFVNIYNGIGITKKLYRSIKLEDIIESSYGDWQLTNQVTFESGYISKVLRASKTDDFVTIVIENPLDNIKIWPNPVSNGILNIELPDNTTRKIVRIYSVTVALMFETYIESDKLEMNVSTLKPGMYVVIISDQTGIVLNKTKVVVLN
jgi:hypothetical protein